MKKLFFAAMASLLVFSLAACGSDSGKSDSKAPETKAETETVETEAQTEPETEPVETEAETEPADDTKYEAGVWTDDVYTNESLNMTFTLPEGWVYGTSEELEEIQSQGQQVTGTSDEALAAAEERTVYDLYIYNPTTQANIIMMGEDLSQYGNVTAEQYADLISSQLTALDSDEISYDVDDPTEMKIGGCDFVVLSAEATVGKNSLYQFYGITEKGGCLISMIVTATPGESADECNEIINSIKPIE